MNHSHENPTVVLEHRDGEWRIASVNRAYESRSGRGAAELVNATWPAGGEPGHAADGAEERRRLEHDALHDDLTGLPNRRMLVRRLDEAIVRAGVRSRRFAVMFIDLDGFKGINDSHGHEVGDGVLRTVAARLGNIVRPGDTVARIGGDEFVLLLESIRVTRDARQIERRIEEAIRAPMELAGMRLVAGASTGLGWFPGDGMDGPSLLRHADFAMLARKRDRPASRPAELRQAWLRAMPIPASQ